MENLQVKYAQMSSVNYESSLEKKKFDLVIIGGGPSATSFISYLFQKKLADKIFSYLNILIIEKNQNFGSGCLGKYGINSNTSAEGFTRLICFSQKGVKDKNGKFALSPTKNSMRSSKNFEIKQKSGEKSGVSKLKTEKILEVEKDTKLVFKKIPIFNDLYESSIVQLLLSLGNRPAPLSLVGHFLDSLGNFLVHHISKNYGKNILLNEAEVKSIKLYNNEEYGIVLKRNSSDNIIIKTKSLILCSGGLQSNQNHYYNSIMNIKGYDRVFQSDYVLCEDGYTKIINLLNSCAGKKKVVIIGGSHSGFSSAWILLNSPANYSNLNPNMCKKYNKFTCDKCDDNQLCFCYGEVKDRNWSFNGKDFDTNELEITILYRDHIRVYYPSEEDALQDNYNLYNPKEALNKQGKVYPFVGIRGDAKELYIKIIKNDEKRVNLVRTQNNSEQAEYIKLADVVIWACGYNTNFIPIYDPRNNPIELLTDDLGNIEVGKELQLLCKNKNFNLLKNIYGIGQGYSTKTPEVINGKKARADSIHIYNTHIASKLYKSLEPLFNKILVENIKSNNINNNLKRNSNTSCEIKTKLSKKSEGKLADTNLLLKNKFFEKPTIKAVQKNILNENKDENMENTIKTDTCKENEVLLPPIITNKIKNTLLNKYSNIIFSNTDSNKEIKKNSQMQLRKERMDYEKNVRKNILLKTNINLDVKELKK
jgi:hypothetical protein